MGKTNRRTLLMGAGTLAVLGPSTLLTIRPASATPQSMKEAIAKVIGTAKVTEGKVSLDIPPLVENGNVVPVTVTVDSPMTADNYVKALHIFNEKNPLPDVIGMTLGSRAGKATVATRIRLAGAQKVLAIAEMSDGSFWSDTADVIVTVAACVEGSGRR
jgi:sulfur-oxidizing protein SoxY